MYKTFLKGLVALSFICSNFQVSACDVCGCAMGGTNLGILPQFHKNFIGLQYAYRQFTSLHSVQGTDNLSTSFERFQSLELRGRFHLNKKIQLFILLPFNVNQQTENSVTSTLSGIGDLSTFVNYNLFNNGDSLNKRWKHNFQIGGGIKWPVGNFKKLDENKVLNPNIQTGTGSYDFLLDAIYTVRFNKWGLNNSAFYRVNTTNSDNFKFGNRFAYFGNFFYWANLKGYSLLPQIGINYESSDKDSHNQFAIEQSGGTALFSGGGLDFYYRSFTLGANAFIPIYQNNPIIESKTKYGFTLFYNF